MTTTRAVFIAAVLAASFTFVFLGWPAPGVAPAARAEEPSFWERFKTVFVDWDDSAAPGERATEVAGVRGMDVEEALGEEGYDWEAVTYMEELQVKMEDEKVFLQRGRLGPFQAR